MNNILNDVAGPANLSLADEVYVNGVASDDFRVYYTERSPANAVARTLIKGRVVAI